MPVWAVLALTCVAALAGCTSVGTLLSSNLDLYDEGRFEGQFPIFGGDDIPGDPVGDTSVVVAQPIVRVTDAGTDVISGRKLEIKGGVVLYRLPIPAGGLGFDPERYLVTLRGVRDTHRASTTQITVFDFLNKIGVVVKFEGNRVVVASGDPDETAQPFATDDIHTVGILVNRIKKTVSVEVVEENGGELLKTPELAFLDGAFNGVVDSVRIESASNVPYFVERLLVTKAQDD